MADLLPPLPPLHFVEDSLHVRLLACHDLRIGRNWNARDVRSPFWRLYVNQTDGAAIELADGLYPLRARRIHLIPAWVTFSCQCSRTLEHLYIHFELLGLPAPVSRQVFDRPLTLAADVVTAWLARRLGRRAREPHPDESALTATAKSLVYLSLGQGLARTHAPALRRMHRGSDPASPVWPALQYIEEHLAEDLSNEHLAQLCGLSCDHFARRFRQAAGQTPARYVLERRIAQAAQDLTFTGASIDQIARQRGFANRFHFTRVFTRHMGLAPAAYRRQPRI